MKLVKKQFVETIGVFAMTNIPEAAVTAWLEIKGLRSPYEVNSGSCEDFAQDMQHFIPDSDIVGTDNFDGWDTKYPGHIWLFDGTKHYDSEALEGVTDWKDLPIIKRFIEKMNKE